MKNSTTSVAVSGDGDTSLDLFVYDEKWANFKLFRNFVPDLKLLNEQRKSNRRKID
ncbi:hypothetical protein AGMMS49982_00620 [Bacteroidia bacterium]|nr:hypothetical protein AGMMS49982_00620 [Bacteroidia bacterium]